GPPGTTTRPFGRPIPVPAPCPISTMRDRGRVRQSELMAVPALPSGIVTFLFSDIEGSTRLFRELGDRYPEILDLHNQALRKVWEEHSGEWMSPGEVTPSWPRFPWATPITLEAWWTVMATYPSPRGAANPLWRPILTDLLSADRS